jgi:glutathione-regulated potassium-efflux system ancillary protein KefF
MKNILIISGHTDLNDSVANKGILAHYKTVLPEAEIVYLDKLYPDFKINIKAEQARLVKADIIILQYPFFWYHMPSIMERWMEETFEHGFSHGSTGDKLKGKKLIASFTMGSPAEDYRKKGPVGYEVEDFLPPLKATCALTQMEFAGYVYTGSVSYQSRNDPQKLAAIKKKAVEHADKVVALVKNL